MARKVFQYVDDFVVLGSGVELESFKCAVLDVFKANGEGLKFTGKVPVQGTLEFLDLELRLPEHHACWMYVPRSSIRFFSFKAS